MGKKRALGGARAGRIRRNDGPEETARQVKPDKALVINGLRANRANVMSVIAGRQIFYQDSPGFLSEIGGNNWQ